MHAIERYAERVRCADRARILGDLVRLSERAHFVRSEHDGCELWRVGRPERLRFIVDPRTKPLPTLVTVKAAFDRG